MKRIRIFILILFVFMVTGCEVNYNLEINEDLSLSETVEASENTRTMQNKTNLVGEEAVSYLHDMFAPSGVDFESTEENGVTTGTAFRSFSSLKDYKDSFTSDLFSNISYKKSANTVTLTAKQSQKLSSGGSASLVYDKVNINISLPFTVKENNADEVSGNTYTWNIDKGKDLKNIQLIFDTKTKSESVNISVGKDVVSIKYTYIAIGAFIVIIVSIIIFVTIQNKKNNRL